MNDEKEWNANKYNKHADFVSNLASDVVELLDAQKWESILDLGCGDGTLSCKIKEFGSQVSAVDLSPDMVEKTKDKGINAFVMSATNIEFTNEFDAVFSNAVLHWVKTPEVAIKEIFNSLKSDGRFVAEFGGFENIKHLVEAMGVVFTNHPEFGVFNNPWYFAKEDEYKKLLEKNGFRVTYIETIKRPTKIDYILNWLDVFANGIISHLSKDQQEIFKNEVRDILKPKIYTQKDGWVVDYVRLRVRAVK